MFCLLSLYAPAQQRYVSIVTNRIAARGVGCRCTDDQEGISAARGHTRGHRAAPISPAASGMWGTPLPPLQALPGFSCPASGQLQITQQWPLLLLLGPNKLKLYHPILMMKCWKIMHHHPRNEIESLHTWYMCLRFTMHYCLGPRKHYTIPSPVTNARFS